MSVRPPPPCLYASHTAKMGVQLCMHFNLQKPYDHDSLIIFLNKPILPFPCCPRPCMITPSHYNGGATALIVGYVSSSKQQRNIVQLCATPLTAPLELLNATNYHLFGQPSPTTPYRCPSQFKLDSIFLNFCQFQMNILQNSATLV